MAGVAILLEFFFVQWPFVTRRASCLDVFATQDILGIGIVVKGRWLPGLHTVTGFTLLTVLTFVTLGAVIVFPVAGDTFFRRIFVFVELVTVGALHIRMFTFKCKLGFTVIEPYFFPVLFGVAIATFLTQRPFMGIVFLVTDTALLRCLAVLLGGLVALLACQWFVLAFQQIIRLAVIELLGVETGNFLVPTFVVGMALITGLRFQGAVIACLVLHVNADLFVASGTQS